MFEWWLALPAALKAATVTAGATLVAAAFGFAVIFYQLGRQSRNAIEQNRKNEALKLKVQIYERVVETSAAAQEAVGELSNYLRQFTLQLAFACAPESETGIRPRPPEARYPEYSRLRSAATQGRH